MQYNKIIYFFELLHLPLILILVLLFSRLNTRRSNNILSFDAKILNPITFGFLTNLISVFLKIISNDEFPLNTFSIVPERLIDLTYITVSNWTSYFFVFAFIKYINNDSSQIYNRHKFMPHLTMNVNTINILFLLISVLVGFSSDYPETHKWISFFYSVLSLLCVILLFEDLTKKFVASRAIFIGFVIWLVVQIGLLFMEGEYEELVSIICFSLSFFGKLLILIGSTTWYVIFGYKNLEKAIEEEKLKDATQKTYDKLHEILKDILHDIFDPINLLESKLEVIENNDFNKEEDVKEINYSLAYVRAILELSQESYNYNTNSTGDNRENPEYKRLRKQSINKLLQLSFSIVRAKLRDSEFDITLEPKFAKNKYSMFKCRAVDIVTIFTNLISNAIDSYSGLREEYSSERIIYVETKNVSNDILVMITDKGKGIPDHIKEKIFNPGFSTKDKEGLKGHGLYKARETIGKYTESEITFTSKYYDGNEVGDHGTTFSIMFKNQKK